MPETWIQSLGRKDPLEERTATHSNILPGESHGQSSLVGYSSWGHKESDTTEAAQHPHVHRALPPFYWLQGSLQNQVQAPQHTLACFPSFVSPSLLAAQQCWAPDSYLHTLGPELLSLASYPVQLLFIIHISAPEYLRWWKSQVISTSLLKTSHGFHFIQRQLQSLQKLTGPYLWNF